MTTSNTELRADRDPRAAAESVDRAAAGSSEAPFFIVGCPRSGTTLLSLMIDAHPRLAVPPESHFIIPLAPRRRLGRMVRVATVEDILPFLTAREWDVDHAAVRAAVEEADSPSYPELVSAVFSTYAATHGKRRWGDKTPRYVDHVGTLAELFPNARFIHLIRDGREVAASLADRRWGPRDAVLGAFIWRRSIRRARRDGRPLGERYMELRLEDLIAEPEPRLNEICAFLGEKFSPEMLRYAEGPRALQAAKSGFHHALKPPTAGLRDWRKGLKPRQQRAVEAVCRRRLDELGYPSPPRSLTGSAYAWLSLGRRMPVLVLAGVAKLVRHYAPRLTVRRRLWRRGRVG